jgi:hypothetical protein
MSIGAVGSVSSACSTDSTQRMERMRGHRGDPEKMVDRMAEGFLKQSDADGNGTLSAGELSGLSGDSFSALDTDSDGSLTAEEIKAAAKKQMEAMKKAFEAGDEQARQSAMSSLQSTPEGELLDYMRATMPPPKETGAAAYRSVARGSAAGTSSLNVTA